MAGRARYFPGSAHRLVIPLLLAACSGGAEPVPVGGEARSGGTSIGATAVTAVLERGMATVDSAVQRADSLFKPVPLLAPGREDALRAYGNAAQLERARRLGIERSPSAAALDRLQREGRIVPLQDSEYWVVAELDHSQPLVVPGVRALLEEVGERFHEQLAAMGSPLFRFEVSSVLRSAADQEALRRVNPNAALGESTHEYGTTVDLLYSAFAAPAEPVVPIAPTAAGRAGAAAEGAAWAGPFLQRYAEVAAGRVAARRALELKAILGEVLLDLQQEGRVMVTMERQQPVFHMTVAGAP